MKKIILSLILLACYYGITAQDSTSEKKAGRKSFHFQTTTVTQHVGNFKSPYTGSQTMVPEDRRTTLSATYYMAFKLAKHTEFVLNPEMAGGAGLSGVFGMGSFPNAEAMRTGKQAPFYYTARLFLRQTIPLTSEVEWQEEGINQIAGYVPKKRLVVTFGKMALTDYVDGNSLSHDGRTQFLNWTLGTQGAYDFAADNKAYTQGLVLEYITSGWKFRYAFAQLSTEANGPKFNYDLSTAHHQVIEIEKELSLIPNRPGALRVLVYEGVNKYGNFREAMQEDQILPLSETHNRVRTKHGIGVNFEQYITDNSGFYARASMNDGKTEAWSYTEVDRSATAGFSIEGQSWKRPNDKFGIGGGINGLSKSHADYLKAGGTGIILGDGKLRYGNEGVFETFYSFQYNSSLWLTADYQFAVNPGYNKDRGPIWNIVALRVHVEI